MSVHAPKIRVKNWNLGGLNKTKQKTRLSTLTTEMMMSMLLARVPDIIQDEFDNAAVDIGSVLDATSASLELGAELAEEGKESRNVLFRSGNADAYANSAEILADAFGDVLQGKVSVRYEVNALARA